MISRFREDLPREGQHFHGNIRRGSIPKITSDRTISLKAFNCLVLQNTILLPIPAFNISRAPETPSLIFLYCVTSSYEVWDMCS